MTTDARMHHEEEINEWMYEIVAAEWTRFSAVNVIRSAEIRGGSNSLFLAGSFVVRMLTFFLRSILLHLIHYCFVSYFIHDSLLPNTHTPQKYWIHWNESSVCSTECVPLSMLNEAKTNEKEREKTHLPTQIMHAGMTSALNVDANVFSTHKKTLCVPVFVLLKLW